MATSSFDQRFVVTEHKAAKQLRADVKSTKPVTVTVSADKSRADRKKAAALLNRI